MVTYNPDFRLWKTQINLPKLHYGQESFKTTENKFSIQKS